MASSRVEQFYSGECYESNFEVSLVGLSYSECVNECKLRTACASVHYVRTLRLCTLHVGTVQKVPCVHRGTTLAKKLDWNHVSRRCICPILRLIQRLSKYRIYAQISDLL